MNDIQTLQQENGFLKMRIVELEKEIKRLQSEGCFDNDPTGGAIPERRGILAPFYTKQI